ncbi:MAG: hypothetical protein ACKOFZ_00760 [Ilumatobacteraceae bacterium]
MTRRRILGSIVFSTFASAALVACSSDGRSMRPPSSDQTQSVAVPTTSTVAEQAVGFSMTTPWVTGERIDERHTCLGESISPRIEFSNVPSDIVTIGLVLIDESADGDVLWAMANIDPASPVVEEGSIPVGAIVGRFADGTEGYRAPCPTDTHTFQLIGYALPQQVELESGTDARTIVDTLEAAALDVVTSSFVTP